MIREHLFNAATWAVKRLPALRHAPQPLKRLIRGMRPSSASEEPDDPDPPQSTDDYAQRLQKEQDIFAEQSEVHDLPEIFHYWSNTHLRPRLEEYGFSNPDQFFARYLHQSFLSDGSGPTRFASIGAGNCDTEIRMAKMLSDLGLSDFTIECVDINEAMLHRGKHSAIENGVSRNILCSLADFNTWRPVPQSYSAIMANQSLHHVVGLEQLFASIESALTPDGRFLTSDMIGRNGHMRWPEAMDIVHEYWRELTESKRWNHQLGRYEELHEYWDCSNEGFEGIRSQDILPLLIERFAFELFLPYGNVIDPFVDRSFGPNFDPDSAEDRERIDRIHMRDQEEILAGNITPTHLIAVMRKRPYSGDCKHPTGLTPSHCVRHAQFERHERPSD